MPRASQPVEFQNIDPSHHVTSLVDGDWVCTLCHVCSCHSSNLLFLCPKAPEQPEVVAVESSRPKYQEGWLTTEELPNVQGLGRGLLPGCLLVKQEDGTWAKVAPGIGFVGLKLTKSDVDTLKPVLFEGNGLEFKIVEQQGHSCSCHVTAQEPCLVCKALNCTYFNSQVLEEARPQISRSDNYRIYIDDVPVIADIGQERRIRELDDQQLRNFKRIFGG